MRVLVLIALFAPVVALAVGFLPLVPCQGPLDCDLCNLLKLIENIVNFLFAVAFVVGAIFVAWGGIVIMTAGGSEEREKKGKEVLWIAVIGVVIALTSWLLLKTFVEVLSGGKFNPFASVQCAVTQNPQPSPTPQPPTTGTTTPPTKPPAKPPTVPPPTTGATYGEQEARTILASDSIEVNKDPCPAGVPYQSVSGGCTSLNGISQAAINGVVQFKTDCNCIVIVTGGTELGHTGTGPGTHAGGDKLDIAQNTQVNSYIENNYQFLGVRSDGASLYRSPGGAIYAKETDHWDVKGWDACYAAKGC